MKMHQFEDNDPNLFKLQREDLLELQQIYKICRPGSLILKLLGEHVMVPVETAHKIWPELKNK